METEDDGYQVALSPRIPERIVMTPDLKKSKGEHVNTSQSLKSGNAETDSLQERLKTVERSYHELQNRYEALSRTYEQNCFEKDHTEETLSLAQVIINSSPAILFRRIAGDDPRLVYVSDNIRQMGYTAQEFLSKKVSFRDIVHPEDVERVGKEIQNYKDRDVEEYTQVYRLLTKTGDIRWVEDQTSVVRDSDGVKTHNQGILVDITDKKVAEEHLRKSEEKFRRIVETTIEGFILMDENLVIMDVNDAFCRMLGYLREEILGKTPLDLAAGEFKEFMITNKEALLSRERRILESSLIARDGHHVPILIHGNALKDDQGNVIGNMAFVTDMTESKKTLALASEVQKSLLPQGKPRVKGFDIAGKNVSCDEVGGDYFDFLWQHDSRKGPFSVVVGDISGHGVDSALLMTTARAFLRMRASQPGSISDIITAMNRHLTRDVLESGMFMTLFYLTIDPGNRSLEWVRAGHDPALVYDPGRDQFEELKGQGIALGVSNAFDYKENAWNGLADGQIIAIGTDGIWEAVNKEGKMFGKDRFRNIIRSNSETGASDILNSVYNELNRYTHGQKSEDDITLVIIKVDGLA
jgi:sigma-B regulation protein RsbU (phosphoserine phosphatase)